MRERTTQEYLGGKWNAFCSDCDEWSYEAMARRQLFQRGRKHAAETGHKVIIMYDQDWAITKKEEA